jgi:ABC-type enterobactin transport system permease subunit
MGQQNNITLYSVGALVFIVAGFILIVAGFTMSGTAPVDARLVEAAGYDPASVPEVANIGRLAQKLMLVVTGAAFLITGAVFAPRTR